jgi:hypothetical protein
MTSQDSDFWRKIYRGAVYLPAKAGGALAGGVFEATGEGTFQEGLDAADELIDLAGELGARHGRDIAQSTIALSGLLNIRDHIPPGR